MAVARGVQVECRRGGRDWQRGQREVTRRVRLVLRWRIGQNNRVAVALLYQSTPSHRDLQNLFFLSFGLCALRQLDAIRNASEIFVFVP